MTRSFTTNPLVRVRSRLLLFSSLVSSVVVADVPLVTVPQVPLTAGQPDWRFAPQVTGFQLAQGGRLAKQQTFAQTGYDARNLYVRFRCPVPDTKKLQGEKQERDGAVWQDDAVEFFVDPLQSKKRFYHFIVNCRGSRYDSRDGDAAWNGEWDCAVEVSAEKSEWTCALVVPFSTLERETPKPGEQWGVNFCADSTLTNEQGGWSYTERKFEQPALFGVLVFQPDAPAVKLHNLHELAVGRQLITMSVASCKPTQVTLTGQISNSDQKPLDQKTHVNLPQAGESSVGFPLATNAQGDYLADFRAVDASGATIFLMQAPLLIRPPVLLTLRKFLLEGVVEVTVDATLLPQPGDTLRAVVVAASPEGSLLDRKTLTSLPSRKGLLSLRLGDAVGKLKVSAKVTDANGQPLASDEKEIERPPTPAWFNTTAGLTDKVLTPFESIRLKGDRAKLWGRVLDFKGRLLPASILSQGAELLKAPINFTLRTGGRDVTPPLKARLWDRSRLAVSHASDERTTEIRVRGETTLEFDGCLKVAVEVAPQKRAEVELLTLDIPLRPEVAKYLHTCSATWGDTQSRAIPKDGWKSKFMPYVWVGDEDRGLAWFMESDEVFSNADTSSAIEIVPQADRTVLRVRLIDKLTTLDKPLKLVFGLQPTPVKPVPHKKPRLWHGAYYGMERQTLTKPCALQLPAVGNINLRQGTLEIVATLDFDPEQVKKEQENQTLFHLKQPNGDQVCLWWDYVAEGMWFYVGLGEGYPQKYPIHITTGQLNWKKGETHCVALTWGAKTAMFLDGRQAVVSAPHEGWMPGELTAEKMSFGTEAPNNQGDWILHAYRISATSLSAEELAANAALVRENGTSARLPLGPQTLVLHHPRLGTAAGQLNAPQKIAVGKPSLLGDASAQADGVRLTMKEAISVLDYLKRRGVEVVVYHDKWTNHYGYPSTVYGDKLKSLTKACHDRGMKLILYFGYGLGNLTPEMQLYHDEWTVWPLMPWYGGVPERCFDAGCNNSPLTQFLLDGIDKLTDDCDIDGVYLDGTTEPFGCINPHHGCGYQRDGVWKRTFPVWANRDFIRRMCTIFRQKRKESIVDVHMSANLTIPTLAFCDSLWDGEQFEGYVQGQKDPRSLLPLDSFRAEFMGRQFGLLPEFLVYEGRPFTTDEALAVTLLHDVPVRATGLGDTLEKLSTLWKAQDEFGIENAEFLPYWSNRNLLRADPEGVYVSAYRRKGVGVLLVMSNLGKTEVEARIWMEARKLGLDPTKMKAYDASSRQPVACDAHGLQSRLAPMQWRTIWIRG